MKRPTIGALAIVALLGSWAAAQYYGGAYVNNKASTVGESYARGMGDVMRSQGMRNLANSEAAINMTSRFTCNFGSISVYISRHA